MKELFSIIKPTNVLNMTSPLILNFDVSIVIFAFLVLNFRFRDCHSVSDILNITSRRESSKTFSLITG
jgi:hypothetical protein